MNFPINKIFNAKKIRKMDMTLFKSNKQKLTTSRHTKPESYFKKKNIFRFKAEIEVVKYYCQNNSRKSVFRSSDTSGP